MQRTNTKSNYVCKYQKRKRIIRVRYIIVTLRLKDNTIYVRPVQVAPGLIGKMLHPVVGLGLGWPEARLKRGPSNDVIILSQT